MERTKTSNITHLRLQLHQSLNHKLIQQNNVLVVIGVETGQIYKAVLRAYTLSISRL